MNKQNSINRSDSSASKVLNSKFSILASSNQNSENKQWSIDRVGRFILGFVIIGIALIILFGGIIWTILLVLTGLNLIVTSIINNCLFNKLLSSFGFKEREEIYEPGGQIKNNNK